MIYAHARILFDEMDADQKDRVTRAFDLIRLEDGFPRVYDAFVQAVVIEAERAALNETLTKLERRYEQDHGH
jgi:hypothetical protein